MICHFRISLAKSSCAASMSMFPLDFSSSQIRSAGRSNPVLLHRGCFRCIGLCSPVSSRPLPANPPDFPDIGELRVGRMRLGSATNCAKSGWAMSVPVESKITAVPCAPGRCELTKSLKLSSLRSAAMTPAHFSPQRCTHGYHRSADAERNVGRRDDGPVCLMVAKYQRRLRAS